MNAALIAACATSGTRKRHDEPIYFSSYTPEPKPKYTVAVTLEQNRYMEVIHSYSADVVDIKFKDEMGLIELDSLIRKLMKARDSLEESIFGGE